MAIALFGCFIGRYISFLYWYLPENHMTNYLTKFCDKYGYFWQLRGIKACLGHLRKPSLEIEFFMAYCSLKKIQTLLYGEKNN